MTLSRMIFLVLITPSIALAQPQQDWIPQGIEALGQNASSRTEFTLDHSMLVLASKLDQDDVPPPAHPHAQRSIASASRHLRCMIRNFWARCASNTMRQDGSTWSARTTRTVVQARLISGSAPRTTSLETSQFSSPDRLSSTLSRFPDRLVQSISCISPDTSASLRLKAEPSFLRPAATGRSTL